MGRILKIKSKRAPHKMVGASVKIYLAEYLTLYSLAKGISKSRLIKEYLDGWMKETRMKETDEMLIIEIANRINDKRSTEPRFHKIPLDDFKHQMENELKRNGLKLAYINTVMQKITE